MRNNYQILIGKFKNQSRIILLFNRDSSTQKMSFQYGNVGSMRTMMIKDALTNKEIGKYDMFYTTDVPVIN